MSVNIGPRIGIEGEDTYRKQIMQIIQETKTLKSEYEKVTSAFDKGKQSLSQNAEMHKVLQERIEAQKERIEQLNHMLGVACDQFGEASQKTLKWEQAVNEATAELNRMQRELDDLPNSIELVGQKMQAVGDTISKAGEKITKFGNVLAPLSAAASGVLIGSTKAAIDFETAMTGVQKTNNELVDSNGNVIISYADLADSVKKMATETASSKEEIAGVMEAAGQLGVGTEYLEDFTRTMVMMGDSTNLSADEAASALAKFANVTQMSLSDTDKLGSVIVALGNNFATTEQDIVEMATRLSGAGHQIGLTDAQIMGFATALSSVGIEAEMGGSAFSKAMIKMQVASETGFEQVQKLTDQTGMSLRDLEMLSSLNSKAFKELAGSLGMTAEELKSTITAGNNLNDFARIAGMSTEKFVALYRDDAPAALQAFISGLGDTEAHGESTIQMLQEMGFTEVRLRDTLTRLASSGDLVTTAIDMGNKAWAENTALTEEASKKYDTTAARASQAREKITNVAIEIGERMLPVMEKLADALDKAVAAWDGLDESQKDAITNGLAVTAGLAPVILTVGKLTENIGTLTSSGGSLIEALGGITSSTGAANGAMAALSPATLGVVAAVAALGAAFVTAYQNNEDFREKTNSSLNDIKTSWDGFINEVAPKWNEFCQNLAPVFLTAFDGVKEIIGQAKLLLGGAFDFFSGLMTLDLKRVLDGAWRTWSTAFNLWTMPLKTISNFIKHSFGVDITQSAKDIVAKMQKTWDNFVKSCKEAWDGLCKGMSDLWNYFRKGIDDGIKGIQSWWNGLTQNIKSAWDGTTSSIRSAWQSTTDFLNSGINNVRSWWDGLTQNLKNAWDGTTQNLKSAWDGLTQNVRSAWDGATQNIKSAWDNTTSTLRNAWQGVVNFFDGGINNIKNFFSGLWNDINNIAGDINDRFNRVVDDLGNMFSDFVRNATNWGRDLIDNFIGGIYDMWDNARGVVEDFANMIADFLAFSEPEKGPLSDFHTYAPDMMKLFAKGIRDNANLVTNQIARSFDFQDLMTSGVALPVEMMPTAYAQSPSNTVTVGDTQIVINAVDGETAEELADKVSDIINMRYRKAEMAWA